MERITSIQTTTFDWVAPRLSERDTIEVWIEWLQQQGVQPPDPERTGVYCVSPNAGFGSAVEFWREGLQKGMGLANPEAFPWTLANAPAAAVARHWGFKGPNFTFCADKSGISFAQEQAHHDLSQNIISAAWVLYMVWGTDVQIELNIIGY
jgi:hypothetical protein